MPRGESPNSKKALEENRKKTQFSGETAVIANQKSLETKAALKTFRQMDLETTNPKEREEMLGKLKLMARRGNLKALELYLKIIGEDVQKVEVHNIASNPMQGLTEEELRKLAGGDNE